MCGVVIVWVIRGVVFVYVLQAKRDTGEAKRGPHIEGLLQSRVHTGLLALPRPLRLKRDAPLDPTPGLHCIACSTPFH